MAGDSLLSFDPVSVYRNNDLNQGLAPAREQTNPGFWQALYSNNFSIQRFAELLDPPIRTVRRTLKDLWTRCEQSGWKVDFGPNPKTMQRAKDRNAGIVLQLGSTAMEMFKELNHGGIPEEHLKTLFGRFTKMKTGAMRQKLKYPLDPQKSGGKGNESARSAAGELPVSNTAIATSTASPVPDLQNAVSRGLARPPVHNGRGSDGKLQPRKQSTVKVIDLIGSDSESNREIVTSCRHEPQHAEGNEQTEYIAETHTEDHPMQTLNTPHTRPTTTISPNGTIGIAARVGRQSADIETIELSDSDSEEDEDMLKRESTSQTEDTKEKPSGNHMLKLLLDEAEAELKVARLRRQLGKGSA